MVLPVLASNSAHNIPRRDKEKARRSIGLVECFFTATSSEGTCVLFFPSFWKKNMGTNRKRMISSLLNGTDSRIVIAVGITMSIFKKRKPNGKARSFLKNVSLRPIALEVNIAYTVKKANPIHIK
jgi:hypothetical protein